MKFRRESIPPIILAVRDPGDLPKIVQTEPPGWLFILGGSLEQVAVATVKLTARSWTVFVHVDMVKGMTNDFEGIRFLQTFAHPAGIISTHPFAISHAKKVGLLGIQRVFLLDSQSIESGLKQVDRAGADIVEVLPGILPDMISALALRVSQPLIAGGLITSERQVAEAREAGAVAISTSDRRLYHRSGAWEAPTEAGHPSVAGQCT